MTICSYKGIQRGSGGGGGGRYCKPLQNVISGRERPLTLIKVSVVFDGLFVVVVVVVLFNR